MGLDLHIQRRTRSISRQLVEQIRTLIHDGRLLPGELLPPVRDLARQLGINHQTILRAFNALKAEGLIESTQGSGTRVCGARPPAEILVVFDVASFEQPLSPGYTMFFKRINDKPLVRDLHVASGEVVTEARLTPVLSPAETGASDFLRSPLLARLEAGGAARPLGVLFIGYSASERMQACLAGKRIPFAGVGSVGQYPLQTQHPFRPFIRTGIDRARRRGMRRIALVYPGAPPGKEDVLGAVFRAETRKAGLQVRHEWVMGEARITDQTGRNYLRAVTAAGKDAMPELILAADDVIAAGIAREAEAQGLHIPADFDMFAFWNAEFAPEVPFAFPKAIVDANELFDKALALLLAVIEGKRSGPCTVQVSMTLREE
ncbi:MAG: GntR family transcriptional regulator [Kiritimatiellae bacterium]|nr:GntR family transcriptional regulator [Kiritimatiellia bacterium]